MLVLLSEHSQSSNEAIKLKVYIAMQGSECDISSRENTHFAKLCYLVVDICRDVLWDILVNYIPAADLQQNILANLKTVKLHTEQIYKIRSVPYGSPLTKEYFDVSGLCRILKTICPNLPPPTRGWGQTPLAVDLAVADDIERINQLRNRIYGHTTTSYVSDSDFNIYWKDMRRVIGRIDGEFDTENLAKMRDLKSKFLDLFAAKNLKDELQRSMEYDKETRDLVCGLEERLAVLEKTINDSTGDKAKGCTSQNLDCLESNDGNSHSTNDETKPKEIVYNKLTPYMTLSDNTKQSKTVEKKRWSNLPKTIRMIVVGKTGVGKSSFCNTMLGWDSFEEDYSNVSRTTLSNFRTICRFGKTLSVYDTPGFFDTRFDLQVTSREVSWGMVLTDPGPHVFLIVLRCDVRFSREECEVIDILESHFGKQLYEYSVVVFTHKDHLLTAGGTEEKLLSVVPPPIKELLKQVNNRYIFVNNRETYENNEETVKDLLDKINTMYTEGNKTVYQNENLVQDTLNKKFKRKYWWQFWK